MRRNFKSLFTDQRGKRYGEMEYGGGKVYNDGVVQAVTFAYLIY